MVTFAHLNEIECLKSTANKLPRQQGSAFELCLELKVLFSHCSWTTITAECLCKKLSGPAIMTTRKGAPLMFSGDQSQDNMNTTYPSKSQTQ